MLFPFLVILPGLIAIALPTQNLANLAGTHAATTIEGRGLIPAKMDASGQIIRDKDGTVELDYDLATPNMLLHYFPTGILGLGLTALLASFMSGMAGNVTAFNTVWTYDIYQSYINKKASDEHYLWMGRMATIFGIALSIATAYMVIHSRLGATWRINWRAIYTESSSGLDNVRAWALKSSTDSFSSISSCCNSNSRPPSSGA